MDINSFEKPRYTFGGIYRGFVEDNDDPTDSGCVRLRILGIHDTENTPVEDLPWAKPALGLHWSGGYNINNDDHITDPPKENKGLRYDPGTNSLIAGENLTAKQYENKIRNTNAFASERIDPYGNAGGTGGQFVVPKRGNWVFCFFEAGNHMNAVYFAMAPMERDWATQKKQRDAEISQKIKQITSFKSDFDPRTKSESLDSKTWAEAKLNIDFDKPDLKIEEIPFNRSNRDIYCTTTAQGTTFIVDNRANQEKIYIIHKNSIEYTDPNGNKKIYIGKQRNIKNENMPNSKDGDQPCNYEIGVEGNHEVYVLGKYKLYAKNGAYIQVDGDAIIDVKKDVGVVSQEGNVKVLVKKGNLEADIAGNANINIQKNANIKINKNANINIAGNLKTTVGGSSDLTLKGEVKLSTDGDLNLSVNGITKLKTNSFDINTTNLKVSGNTDIGGNVKIGGNLDITANVSVGQFAYVFAGINCGGSLINKGFAELGSPCILHTATIIPGMAPGTGKFPQSPTRPSAPTSPTEASKES